MKGKIKEPYKEYWIGDMFSVRVSTLCPFCGATLSIGIVSISLGNPTTVKDWICPKHEEVIPYIQWHFPSKDGKEQDIWEEVFLEGYEIQDEKKFPWFCKLHNRPAEEMFDKGLWRCPDCNKYIEEGYE